MFSSSIFAASALYFLASASVFSKVAVPEMLKYDYNPRFAVGVVAGSSVLGMLIPPSVLLIVYGLTTETSIGALFIAGILPGIGGIHHRNDVVAAAEPNQSVGGLSVGGIEGPLAIDDGISLGQAARCGIRGQDFLPVSTAT